MSETHPWKLCAPWYRWKQQGGAPRATRPALQKYESGDCVNAFLKDPQRSLKFNQDDLVVTYEPVARLASGPFAGKLPVFVAPKGAGAAAEPPAESVAKPGQMRKLFLDTHKRHYLIVCELHCDMPGFPSVGRGEVCEAGFVIRRRRQVLSQNEANEVAKILNSVDLATLAITKVDHHITAQLDAKRGLSKKQFIAEALKSPLQKERGAAIEQLRVAQEQLKVLQASGGVKEVVEGWVASAFDKIGAWKPVDEAGQVLTESTFPLYPLIPDPRVKGHAGQGATMYFGLVPTGSADTEDDGTARFDPQSTYEIRCFVRRHKVGCTKKPGKTDCPGDIVWSDRTEAYKLAAHFDLVGTSHRPVTMQLPNIPELAAQAASLPPTKLAPFRMASPNAASNLGFNVDTDSQKGSASPPGSFAEICSFAIPLITIVATFVFKLFLPIVTLVFGLFFLLKLKFCIPPSFSLEAGVSAVLDVVPPSVDLDVGLLVEVKADLAAKLGIPEADVEARVRSDLLLGLGKNFGPALSAQFGAQYSNEALLSFEAELGTNASGPAAASLTASMDFEVPVARAEVEIA